MSEPKQFNCIVGDTMVTFETGRLAKQAGGAVTVRVEDTVLLATATMAPHPRPGVDFMPLSVDFEERLYAVGRIPGSFFRREGRPGESSILISRLTDRPLRPLFPKDLRNEVQVIITPLSIDGEVQFDIMAINAASAALTISNIPFGVAPYGGPIGAVRIGRINGELVLNPTFSQMKASTLDLRVAGTRDAILMVECGAQEVPEDVMVAALRFAHESLQPFIDVQLQMAAEVGKPKSDFARPDVDEEKAAALAARVQERVIASLSDEYDKAERKAVLDAIEGEVLGDITNGDETGLTGSDVRAAIDKVLKKEVRRRIIEDGIRPDGRTLRQIRPLSAAVGVLPRTHGTGLFERGETQVLSVCTLGSPGDAQRLDTVHPEEEKRYLHHYNFPPYSTGEAKLLRGSSRREIGHGALAERALLPVLPPKEEFPYTVRVVSEAISSNGSTSMASVCGSTLALMDAGVPIRKPVAGIAMGLIMEGEKYAVLTDIQGMEDHLGDMDFKVAGTTDGITALQMDIKIAGITPEIMSEALSQALEARLQVLEVMKAAIAEPRAEMSPYAPRLFTLSIPADKIGQLIGPGGKTIRSIQDKYGVSIDIDNATGLVYVAGTDGAMAEAAREYIAGMTESAVVGQMYTGKVVRIESFGVFVEILPGTDGMVHISQLDSRRVESPDEVVSIGDEITVMVTDVTPEGKIRLSRQAVLEGWTAEEAASRDKGIKPGGGRSGGGDRGRRDGGRGGRPGGDRGPRRDGGNRGGGDRGPRY